MGVLMPTKVLSIDLIQVLGTVQPRATLNEDAIADYAEHYAPDSKHPLPPLRVFYDGERYILSRGFHRYTAATRAKRASLECEIMDGDERAAVLDAMLDNDAHGVRLTPADKRKAVNRLLDDKEWRRLTQAKIAEMANVSPRMVQMMVAERRSKTPSIGHDAQMRMPADSGRILIPQDDEEKSSGRDGKNYPKSKPGVKGGIAAAAQVASVWDNIAPNLKPRLNEIKPGQAELTRLSEYNMDEQREIVKLVDDSKIKTVGEAIGDYEGPAQAMTPAQELANSVRKQLGGLIKTIDNTRIGIDKVLGTLDGKRPKPDFAQEALDSLDEARKSLANWQKKVR
jgi:hypothetical protein